MKTEQLNDKMRPFFRIYACTYKSFLKLISKETTKRVTDKTAIEMDRQAVFIADIHILINKQIKTNQIVSWLAEEVAKNSSIICLFICYCSTSSFDSLIQTYYCLFC